MKLLNDFFLFLTFSSYFLHATTLICSQELNDALLRLQHAYPAHIEEATSDYILWTDGTIMLLDVASNTEQEKLTQPSLYDHVMQPTYILGEPAALPYDDPGRIRYEPFFRKMYGANPEEVESNLEKIVWMPRVFGDNAPVLPVTRINNVHEKIQSISCELEELVFEHPEYIPFLEHPAGTYCWRVIADTNRLSPHSFGMTLDITAELLEYWQWDLKKEGREIDENEELAYRNSLPWDIVAIFEKYGFIWGGKWYHYDTLHFEYRPELMVHYCDYLN